MLPILTPIAAFASAEGTESHEPADPSDGGTQEEELVAEADDVDADFETSGAAEAAEPGPITIAVHGFLIDEDQEPMDGSLAVELALFDGPAESTPIFVENQQIEVYAGWFATHLGSTETLELELLLAAEGLFLEIIDPEGALVMPRFQLSAYAKATVARAAANARTLGGRTAEDYAASVAGEGLSIDEDGVLSLDPGAIGDWLAEEPEVVTQAIQDEDLGGTQAPESCGENQTLKSVDGAWSCADDPVSAMRLGSGLLMRGDELRFLAGCSNGQIPKFLGGEWRCADDNQDRSTAGDGLVINGDAVQLLPGCSAGQIPKYTADGWSCGNDLNTGTDVSYAAGSGLALDGTTFSLLRGCQDNQILKFSTADGWACAFDSTASTTLKGRGGIQVEGLEIRFLPDCVDGAIPRFESGTGWTCSEEVPPPSVDYTAGDGLILDDKTFSLLAGCTPGQITKRTAEGWRCGEDVSRETGDGLQVESGQITLLPECAEGQIPTADESGMWLCDTGHSVDAGDGIAFNGTTVDFLPGCSDQQIAKYASGAGWTCADDGRLDEAAIDGFAGNNGFAAATDVSALNTTITALADSVTALDGRSDVLAEGTTVPVGTIIAFHPNVVSPALPVPTGWQACDGSAISDSRAYEEGGIARGMAPGSITIPNLNTPLAADRLGRYLRGDEQSGLLQPADIAAPGADAESIAAHTHGVSALSADEESHEHSHGGLKVATHNHGTDARPRMHRLRSAGGDTGDDPWGGTAAHALSNDPDHVVAVENRLGSENHGHTLSGALDDNQGDETRPHTYTVVWIMRIF